MEVKTEFAVKQSLKIEDVSAGTISEAVVKPTVAKIFGVSVDRIEVEIIFTSARRLQSGAAQNAEIVATMTVEDATVADSLHSKTKNTAEVGNSFKSTYEDQYLELTGSPVELPVVKAEEPTMQLEIKYVITSTTAKQVEAPNDASAFQTQLKAKQEARGEPVSAFSFIVATPAPTSAPTRLPWGDTFAPTTATPSSSPTVTLPTPAPSSPQAQPATSAPSSAPTRPRNRATESAAFSMQLSAFAAMCVTMVYLEPPTQ